MPRCSLLKQMSEPESMIGLSVLTLWDELRSAARWRVLLSEVLAEGTIRPVVSASFPFDRAADAHRLIGQRSNVGKFVTP